MLNNITNHTPAQRVVKGQSNSAPVIINALSPKSIKLKSLSTADKLTDHELEVITLANRVYAYLKNLDEGKAIHKSTLAIELLGSNSPANMRLLRESTQYLSAQRNENGEALPIGFDTSDGYFIITNSDDLKAYIKTCNGYKVTAEIRYASALKIRLHNDEWFWKDTQKKQGVFSFATNKVKF